MPEPLRWHIQQLWCYVNKPYLYLLFLTPKQKPEQLKLCSENEPSRVHSKTVNKFSQDLINNNYLNINTNSSYFFLYTECSPKSILIISKKLTRKQCSIYMVITLSEKKITGLSRIRWKPHYKSIFQHYHVIRCSE